MAKAKSPAADEPIDEVAIDETGVADELAVLAAKNEALEEQVLQLTTQIEEERTARLALENELKDLRARVEATGNSISFNPAQAPERGRPTVQVDGVPMRFKLAGFVAFGKSYFAADVCEDKELVARLASTYPQLFEPAE